MKVELIDYQKYAREILIYTKSTRLQGGQSLNDVINWSECKKDEHLDYMRETIKSSWEFATYIFEITGVSRNFTHQLVRTRTQSYAQESLRTVDARNHKALHYGEDAIYDCSIDYSMNMYKLLLKHGKDVQYARGVLPTDILTSIIVKTDLRTLHDTAKSRLCTRTQGEYQEVFKAMKDAVVDVHPWAEDFINVACVDNGICIFPNYTKCPVQEHTIKVSDEIKSKIKTSWEETDHVANPVSRDGKTM